MRRTRDRSDLMTVEQVADYLQLNKLTVYKYIRDGRLPAARLGKAYRIRLSDVDAFLEQRMTPARVRQAANAPAGAAARRRVAVRVEEVAVAPPRREATPGRQHGEVSINPMEWVIRGLH